MKTEVHPVTVTFPPDLLMEIDHRAQMLDLSRSQYLRRVSREEIQRATGAKPKETTPELALHGHGQPDDHKEAA